MACYHEGHDADCSHDTECPSCCEVTPAPGEHHCITVPVYPPDSCLEDRP